MAKTKTKWVCQECGFQTSRSLGRCTECGAWGSLAEEIEQDVNSFPIRARQTPGKKQAGPTPLSEICPEEVNRVETGMTATDEVLGGGLVAGSVILLAGDPGVGKSTLLLQLANSLSARHKVLYISGEESRHQVGLRSHRLGLRSPNVLIDSEQNVSVITQRMNENEIAFAFVDSVQALFHPEISSAPGSVSQVRESAGAILATAKAQDICTILVGHVTKDGSIAGPRVLEHMVDVVLHFEGDKTKQLRVLRAVKNRFGSTQEIAIFQMVNDGLKEVDNPSALFLGERLAKLKGERAPSGTSVLASAEGNSCLMLEVQSLVGVSAQNNPRRVANGFDGNRLLQIIAVLEKRIGLSLSRQDVYVNIAGGFESADPAGDLAVAIAVTTSALDRSVDPHLVCIGEIGLTGEIRPVANIERRLKEAARMGFRKALLPKANLPVSGKFDQLEIVGVEYLSEALTSVMPGVDSGKEKGKSAAARQAPAPNAPAHASNADEHGVAQLDADLIQMLK